MLTLWETGMVISHNIHTRSLNQEQKHQNGKEREGDWPRGESEEVAFGFWALGLPFTAAGMEAAQGWLPASKTEGPARCEGGRRDVHRQSEDVLCSQTLLCLKLEARCTTRGLQA